MKLGNIKFACPVCKDGKGKQRYSELSLEKHLDSFHKRVDAAELTDRYVSRTLQEITQ